MFPPESSLYLGRLLRCIHNFFMHHSVRFQSVYCYLYQQRKCQLWHVLDIRITLSIVSMHADVGAFCSGGKDVHVVQHNITRLSVTSQHRALKRKVAFAVKCSGGVRRPEGATMCCQAAIRASRSQGDSSFSLRDLTRSQCKILFITSEFCAPNALQLGY
jgi:hypothetical protein